PAPRGAPRHGIGQAALAQPGEVGHGGPAAGQDHQVGVVDLGGGGGEPDRHPPPRGQRGGVGGGGRPGAADPRPPGPAPPPRRSVPPSPSPFAGAVARLSESSASSQSPAVHGSTPSTGRPVSSRSRSSPGSSRAGSPRNLFTTNPATSAWSSRLSRASVPYSAASAPPRSMSATTITGRPAARARPMLAMSCARRLISAGLPAPSQMTASNRSARPARQASTVPARRGLSAG